jgi:hypothetical protein
MNRILARRRAIVIKESNYLYVIVKIIMHGFVYVSKFIKDLFIANSSALYSF